MDIALRKLEEGEQVIHLDSENGFLCIEGQRRGLTGLTSKSYNGW